ncbi:acetylglutamate kinase [Clostridia bacterium]|nr:acetylglutamate kinase [Clostridia bacterium]
MNIENSTRSQVLIDALPYIQKYNGKIVVVKYGGNAMTNNELKQAVMSDIVLLTLVGIKVVLVHGGGPEIDEVQEKFGIEKKIISGLRYTPIELIDVIKMVLAGKVNKELVALFTEHKGRAIGLCGLDGNMLTAERAFGDNGEDLAYVGNITQVDTRIITDCLEKGYIPVIATIATDDDGNVYNVNADTAASRIASALGAESFILMTDIVGLLKDRDDLNSLIPFVNVSEVPFMKRQGIISGGMLPKIDCCVEAIRRGVAKTSIIDGRVPHSILIEILSNEGIGTQFK